MFNHDTPAVMASTSRYVIIIHRSRSPGAMDRPRAHLGTLPCHAPCRVGQLLRLDHHTHCMPRAEIISQHCAAVLRIGLLRVCALSVSVAASFPLRLLFPVCYSRALMPMAASSLHSTCSLNNDGSRRAKMVDTTPLAIVIGILADGTAISSTSEAERASAHRHALSSSCCSCTRVWQGPHEACAEFCISSCARVHTVDVAVVARVAVAVAARGGSGACVQIAGDWLVTSWFTIRLVLPAGLPGW